jgi:hypothetical protein
VTSVTTVARAVVLECVLGAAPMFTALFVSRAAIDSYNNGVRDGFAYGFLSAFVLAVVVKAIKAIAKNKTA